MKGQGPAPKCTRRHYAVWGSILLTELLYVILQRASLSPGLFPLAPPFSYSAFPGRPRLYLRISQRLRERQQLLLVQGHFPPVL